MKHLLLIIVLCKSTKYCVLRIIDKKLVFILIFNRVGTFPVTVSKVIRLSSLVGN